MFKHQLQKNFILDFVQKVYFQPMKFACSVEIRDPYIDRSNTFRIEFQFAKIKLISSVDKVDYFSSFFLFFCFEGVCGRVTCSLSILTCYHAIHLSTKLIAMSKQMICMTTKFNWIFEYQHDRRKPNGHPRPPSKKIYLVCWIRFMDWNNNWVSRDVQLLIGLFEVII